MALIQQQNQSWPTNYYKLRGGNWLSPINQIRVSDRSTTYITNMTTKYSYLGIRGV